MPAVEIAGPQAQAAAGDVLAVPFCTGPAGPQACPGTIAAWRQAGLDAADLGLSDQWPAELDLAAMLAGQGFRGQPGDAATILVPGPARGGSGASSDGGSRGWRRVAAIGLGPAHRIGAADVRDAAQRLAGLAAGSASVTSTLALAGPDRAESVRAAAEGFLLGCYRVPRAGSRPVSAEQPPAPAALRLLTGSTSDAAAGPGPAGPGADGVPEALARGIVAAQMANWVRDLVHAPAGRATPEMLAETFAAEAAQHGATARIWTAEELSRAGFGGVSGVGQGSRNSPRLVEITHAGAGGPLVVLAGKGITFDSGGLNLKRDPGEISWMRSDMAGGAAVAAAVIAAARLGLPVPAVAVVPLAENMPGGGALRPGDVLTHRGGRTSEVVDTDCEGRLVIADALGYLAEREPAAMLDVATLTDAAGLGPALWAALGTDQALVAEMLAAGEAAGEPGWPLPLPAAYRDLLASPAADLRNTPAQGPDSTVMAAMFLREFAGSTPWVHIDNGSTAWLEYDTGLWPEGATGSPARALLRFLEGRSG